MRGCVPCTAFVLSLAAQSSVNALLSSVSGRATDGSRPPVSQTPRVSNPLRPTGAGDVPACDRRERVGRDSPAGQGCRSVREAPEWGFRGPPGTTLLLPFSGAFDAGALAPFTARRSCPGCPAAWSRRRQGTASAGRVASKLTPGYGRKRDGVQSGIRGGEGLAAWPHSWAGIQAAPLYFTAFTVCLSGFFVSLLLRTIS